MPPLRRDLLAVHHGGPVAQDRGPPGAVDERRALVRGDEDAVTTVAVRVGGHVTTGPVLGARGLRRLGEPYVTGVPPSPGYTASEPSMSAGSVS
ncbi:hypothetical protein [Streptomyces sp. NPDC101455]|uniref:hypothetical protein n=1 Tax=Streptomyces sp. NPDC101455 TaxID=3366142 RepID=UPI0037F79C6A